MATEAEGYRYGSNNGLGITVFEIHPPETTSKEEIAFGFMTWGESGTLLRVDGDPSSAHFIETKLVVSCLSVNVGCLTVTSHFSSDVF